MRLLALALLVVLVSTSGGAARAADAGVADAGADAAAPEDPRRASILALVAGALDAATDPDSLFDVALSDEAAIQADAARIRTWLRAATEAAGPATGKLPATIASTRAELLGVDPNEWQRRIDLDRARLQFYELASSARSELLTRHAALHEAARPKETEAERTARLAAEERDRALEATRNARTEAEHLLATERARLLEIESRVTEGEQALEAKRAALKLRREGLLGWQRRARDAQVGAATEADATYDALRATLHDAREQLGIALSDDLPAPLALGADALADLPPELPAEDVHALRKRLERHIATLQAERRTVRDERIDALHEEIEALNRHRLVLLLSLSPAKRAAITGFTAEGLDQARSEARQLSLVLRYHQRVATRWVTSWQDGERARSYWLLSAFFVPWVVVLAAFVWLRRRMPSFLRLASVRINERARSLPREIDPWRRVIAFALGVHRSLEWLLFFGLTWWLLPESVHALLEVELLGLIIGWMLTGALVVNAINALASGPRIDEESAQLRLRSLHLVGRVVIVFALILLISVRLVGKGTIYEWTLFICWFAAVPVFLVLVRWWRANVFARLERVRRKSTLQTWMLANRSGYKSFLAAMLAAVQLFALGAVRAVRKWFTSINLVRRGLAYLFQRELARLSESRSELTVVPLAPEVSDALSPERDSQAWIPCPADDAKATLGARTVGMTALVGARGVGKTFLVRQLEGALHLNASMLSEAALDSAIGEASGLVVLDDAHVLCKPIRGGLRAFDKVLARLRAASEHAAFVLVIDELVWPFLQRAYDGRPLFDAVLVLEAWRDEQIGALLEARLRENGLEPTFEDLLDPLPPAADDIDRQEALLAKREGYVRMIWDHARGNPGQALEAWRVSLSRGEGNVVRVRALHMPSTSQLEKLSDQSAFVLRAVLQLQPALAADVAAAVRMPEAQVQSALRLGREEGYLIESDGRVRVAWPWLRAVLRLLERRHLVVGA